MQAIKDMEKRTGLTLGSDGWSDQNRTPLLNFIACSPAGGRFIGAVDTTGIACLLCIKGTKIHTHTYTHTHTHTHTGHAKTARYIADQFAKVIDEAGPQHVVAVATDNAPNCKGAGQLIEVCESSLGALAAYLYTRVPYSISDLNSFSS
ncbi:MAG TPA: hypothetical protein VLN72_09285, partial [Gillisia sp.]|nr:hypothetical protein [Gillisia sp.]